jgi:hypothetical protein
MLINISVNEITGVKRGNYDRLDVRHPSNNGGKNVWVRYWLTEKGNHVISRNDVRGNNYIISLQDLEAAEQGLHLTGGTVAPAGII